MVSDDVVKAIDELQRSEFIDGANYQKKTGGGQPSSGRTVNARSALLAAIEAEVEAARRDGARNLLQEWEP